MKGNHLGKSGFTLVEIMIALGIFCLTLSVVIGLFIHFGRSSSRDSEEQEYYRLYTLLESRVKNDIRSARSVTLLAPGVYQLKILSKSESSLPEEKTVVYWVNENGLGVDRFVSPGDHKIRFDFSMVLDQGENFQFEIEVP